MSVERDPRSLGHRTGHQAYGPGDLHEQQTDRSALRRFLGGSPLAVLVRLLVLSILVGAAMALLGLTPGQLFRRAHEAILALIELGFDTFQDFGNWLLAGALVVVPLWLVSRLFAMNR